MLIPKADRKLIHEVSFCFFLHRFGGRDVGDMGDDGTTTTITHRINCAERMGKLPIIYSTANDDRHAIGNGGGIVEAIGWPVSNGLGIRPR
jgi:hypothetical protein